ncbi:hypothetical protein GCM10025734_73280 [Kitasatospora paranensis]
MGVNRREKAAANTLVALRSIRAARPDGVPIYVILDNLSAHKGETIRNWAGKHRAELCFTPTYGSRANPIEAYFGPLRQFTIANSHHRNHTVQTRALHAYLRGRNTNARHRGGPRGRLARAGRTMGRHARVRRRRARPAGARRGVPRDTEPERVARALRDAGGGRDLRGDRPAGGARAGALRRCALSVKQRGLPPSGR